VDATPPVIAQPEYLRHDATALAAGVAAGRWSPTELLATAQAQLARVQPQLNCLLRPLPALAQAQLQRLADPADPARRGPLAGVPMLIKDSVLDVAGEPTSYGSRAFARITAAAHATALQRLLDAGAVVFGKTNLPELGLKGISDSAAFGLVANPWDPARNAGGSSGGSAAAVAAGVVPMAGGNDGGGSLRIPAALCGLFALKPSRGRIPNGPGLGEVWLGACSEGVISRSVRDTALALEVMAGAAPGDPFVAAPRQPWRALAAEPLARPLRVAFSTASPIGTPVDAEAVAAVHGAAVLLRELGHTVEEAAPAIDGAALARSYLALYFGQIPAAMAWAEARGARRDAFEPLTRVLAALGRATHAGVFSTELHAWNDHAQALATFQRRFDLWLLPTTAGPAPLHGALDTPPAALRVLAGLERSGLLGWLARRPGVRRLIDDDVVRNMAPFPFTQIANLTGVPAMTLPLHRSAAGLPLGVQAVGRMGEEALLLQLALQVEAARPWFERLPALAAGADRIMR
jgi:amidase